MSGTQGRRAELEGQPAFANGGQASVAAVTDLQTTSDVYNFAVEGFKTYHVGELGVWVHNASKVRSITANRQSGLSDEAAQLSINGLTSNGKIIRPSVSEVDTTLFRAIVGQPKYTVTGKLVGTRPDSLTRGIVEVKSGSSVLDSRYQTRLQTYFSVKNNLPLTIKTSRPVSPSLQKSLDFWGVKVEKF